MENINYKFYLSLTKSFMINTCGRVKLEMMIKTNNIILSLVSKSLLN